MYRTMSFRRHQDRKHKIEVKKRVWWLKEFDPITIGILAETPQRCSCIFCGNRRKYEGKTKQEKLNEKNFIDMINEFDKN